jgi:hypothetical protein
MILVVHILFLFPTILIEMYAFDFLFLLLLTFDLSVSL